MNEVCFCEETFYILIEAEICADPVWCGHCQANLDLYDFPVSEEIKNELTIWNSDFDKHLTANKYSGVTKSFAEQLNEKGQQLARRLNEELPYTYKVEYRPYTLVIEQGQ